ncbi:MAG: hypothetical protein KAS72_09240 [Phycisphaerales bacterium]|nr:hypothetical protein [Phycisphaerales bacterium]
MDKHQRHRFLLRDVAEPEFQSPERLARFAADQNILVRETMQRSSATKPSKTASRHR